MPLLGTTLAAVAAAVVAMEVTPAARVLGEDAATMTLVAPETSADVNSEAVIDTSPLRSVKRIIN